MGRTLEIIFSSFKMAMQELWKNKLRAALSLLGITIGIFCIISVLALMNSLERNIQNTIQSLGTNTVFVTQRPFGGGMDFPWWKYVNRPDPRYAELSEIASRTPSAKYVAYFMGSQGSVEFAGNSLSGIHFYGVSSDFSDIQSLEFSNGRYATSAEFEQGSSVVVIGDEVAEKLFGSSAVAVDKIISVKGIKMMVIGVIKKQGSGGLGGGFQFDQSIVMPYKFAKTVINEQWAEKFIMVQGRDGLSTAALKDELSGSMRAVRRLKPVQDDNFSLIEITEISEAVSNFFGPMNLIGWIIAGISLLVGMFGVANIMFVTVKERTSQIGLKKAVGAKSRVILTEFLLESTFLCIVGGLIGLLLVFILTQILTHSLHFPIFISTKNFSVAILICMTVGILAGIIPALQAATMNPVTAIRTK